MYRLYREEGLNLRSKRPRRSRAASQRLDRPQLSNIHQSWSMDFVADQLFDGRKIRALTVVDNFSRQCLAIHVGQSLKGEDVVAVMNQLKIVNLAVPHGEFGCLDHLIPPQVGSSPLLVVNSLKAFISS